jgi:hypothetical protein
MLTTAMNYWLFQGNPDQFDVDEYLTSTDKIYWSVSVKKYQSEISIGDLVFLWRAQGKANAVSGVIAKAVVIEPCRPKKSLDNPTNLYDNLWESNSSEKSEIKVGLKVLEYRLTHKSGMVHKSFFECDETLVNSNIIKVRVGSNFKLKNEEYARINLFWEKNSNFALETETNERSMIFSSLRNKMEDVGFQFERSQPSHHQKRKDFELKFVHPLLIERFASESLSVRATKFYIKALSDKPHSEVGLVTGKTSPLHFHEIFPKPNSKDTFGDNPAWVNRSDDKSLDNLIEVINSFIGNDGYFPNEINENVDYLEGKSKTVIVNSYERNPSARKKCVEYYGYKCTVCSFDFQKTYGEIGESFIHVHHIIDLSTIGEEYSVDPITDLIPVCPNCHSMLHKKKPAYTVDELKKMIKLSI